jgi:ribosome-binding protein aMBF1 (putative translation factor)
MRKSRKPRIIAAKAVSQHIEEEFRKSPEFRKSYEEEVARLNIGYKIARLRQMRRLSQAELAKKVRTTQQVISRLEDLKKSGVNVKTLVRIASALNAKLSIDLIPSEINA